MTISNEELFERMFAAQHRAVTAMHNIAGFEEWSALEILALRVFARTTTDLGAIDISRALGISLPHASRIAKRLKARELVTESRWRQFRSLRLTDAGRAYLVRELPNFKSFVDQLFATVSETERAALDIALQKIRSNVSE